MFLTTNTQPQSNNTNAVTVAHAADHDWRNTPALGAFCHSNYWAYSVSARRQAKTQTRPLLASLLALLSRGHAN